MTYDVQVTARAEQDIDRIIDYLRQRSPQGTTAWSQRLQETLLELATTAHLMPLAPEDRDHTEEIRHVVFRTRRGRPYRLLFSLQLDRVFILHARGPGQDLVPPTVG